MAKTRKLLVIDPNLEQARRLERALAGTGSSSYEIQWQEDMPEDGFRTTTKQADAVLVRAPDKLDNRFLALLKHVALERPVLVFQAEADDKAARRLLGVGAEDYLVTGRTDIRSLDEAIRKAIERHRLRRELMESDRSGDSRGKAIESINEMSRLRELNDFKTKLLNTAAHEISTPLTPIRFQTTILKRSDPQHLDDRQRRAIEILDRNVDRLSKLIHDVLDVARLESDNLKIRPQPVDLSQIAHETAEAFHEIARQADVELETELEQPLQVEADPERLAQVFFNLISNAIKFTPEGGSVTVRTRIDEDMAVGAVEDTGVGLKSDDFQKLFQPFSQIEGETLNTPKRGGTGLGLYITQGIIEQHGGRIWCDSPGIGKGSTFSFAIPFRPRPPGEEGAEGEAPAESEPRRRGVWPFIYFHCPMCDSRDIDMRLIKNIYQCNRCRHTWK